MHFDATGTIIFRSSLICLQSTVLKAVGRTFAHTINIGPALKAHLKHGDYEGECEAEILGGNEKEKPSGQLKKKRNRSIKKNK